MSEVAYKTEIADHEIRISPTAAEQLKNLVDSIEDDIAGVRIFVSGGGCGGMTYGMTYAESISEHDKILEGDGFKLAVDAVALSYLVGCDIDFVDNGLNKSFVFNNVFQSVGGTGGCSGCGAGGCGV
jgi:iron-sulfur cluster assembly accessory protein